MWPFTGGFVLPMRVALYVRVSSHDQQTLAMPIDTRRPEEQKAAAAAAATLWASAAGPGQRDGLGPPGVPRMTEQLAATPAVAS